MRQKPNELYSFFFSFLLTAVTWSWKWQFKGSVFLPLSLFRFKHFQLLGLLPVRFYRFKKMSHNAVIAGLCLCFYATNLRIIDIIVCVRVSLLLLEHLCARNEAFLYDISSTFVIGIILCRVDKYVTRQDIWFDLIWFISFTVSPISTALVLGLNDLRLK